MSEGDHVLVLHAPDGAAWAQFLSARLASPSYNINSTLIDITSIPDSSPSSSPSSPPSSSSSASTTQNTPTYLDDEQEDDDAIYTNENEMFGEEEEEGDSIYTNDTTMRNTKNTNNTKVTGANKGGTNRPTSKTNSQLSKSIDESRVCAIFISPEIVEDENAFCIDLNTLNDRKTVFLLLGVELPEVMQYFGSLYDCVSRCRCCFVDGTEETIREGIVSIIEAYECDEDECYEDEVDYKVPNQPVQRNTIDKVFPRMLTETEREVFVLLSRIPEDDVRVVILDSAISLPMTLVCERLYSFVLPPNLFGEVSFQLECQSRRFGEESIHSYSKLDLIQNILASELNPHSLIASSIGLDKDDTGGLDTALAFKLQELAPVMTFKTLCPCEEALKNTDEQSNKMWPTLLHFAADLNLRLLCSELLRYPGMVAAACTENRAGELPNQIANKKGFYQLENDLIEFMKRLRREVDPDYVSSSQCNLSSSRGSSMTSLPETCTGTAEDPATYCDMSETQRLRKPLLGVSQRSMSGHSPSRAPIRTHSDRSDVSRGRSGYSQRPLPKRPDSPSEDNKEDTYSNPEDSPRSMQGSPTSLKALKRLGATEAEVASRYSMMDPKIAATAQMYSATCPPGTLRARLFEDEDRVSVSSNCDIPGLMALNNNTVDPKRGQVRDKVKGFFQKITGSKKSGSSVDVSGNGKKSGSKPRRGSEPTSIGKATIKGRSNKSLSFDEEREERDSGSYSDEEKKQKVFRPSNKPMLPPKEYQFRRECTRRISRRIEYAKKESYGPDAPQLPAHPEDKRATFKSFIL